jgi:glutamate-1-semialdehyde 2,1-aminomutase
VTAVRHLRDGRASIYPELDRLGRRLADGLRMASPRLTVRQMGPIVHTAVGEPAEVRNVRDRASGDPAAHARFIEALLYQGVYATPRGLWYLSTAHTDDEVDATTEAAAAAAAEALA